jgi:5-methylcytosine-specific restriction protein A
VLAALSEHDEIGAEAFRAKYGFDRSWKYSLVHNGKSYDSKAIAGAAHGRIAPGWAPLPASQFSGGKDHAVRNLRRLGFEVQHDAPRNAPWSRDELVLALDLYMSNPASPPGKGSSAVTELSALLNQLGTLTGAAKESTYRNPNGVYMKMMNFRAIDPTFTQRGKVGMTRHGKLDLEVWDEFVGKREVLRREAGVIRKIVTTPALAQQVVFAGGSDDVSAQEGGVLLQLHKRYERDRALADKKRNAVAATNNGKLQCEACNFDFAERYGSYGSGFIEVHHKKPVHTIALGEKTKLGDLALLCANCHRMVHRSRVPLPVEQLRALVR